MMITPLQKNRGYTLLFAVIVSALVLGLGISILNISKKEFLLTTASRDSSAAFYSADGGLECAILANENNVFSMSVDNTSMLRTYCSGSSDFATVPSSYPAAEGIVYVFHIKFGDAGGSCSVVSITKQTVAGRLKTTIDSRGYNIGWNETTNRCDRLSAKRVERAIRYSSY